jgi:hypothetical protein
MHRVVALQLLALQLLVLQLRALQLLALQLLALKQLAREWQVRLEQRQPPLRQLQQDAHQPGQWCLLGRR